MNYAIGPRFRPTLGIVDQGNDLTHRVLSPIGLAVGEFIKQQSA
jgi:hypothetical protein